MDVLSEDGPILNPEDRVLHPLSLHIVDEDPGGVCRRRLCHLTECATDMAGRQDLQRQDHSDEVLMISDSTQIRCDDINLSHVRWFWAVRYLTQG